MESTAAVRTIHFTCIGRGHGAPCLPATREFWEMMRREPWLKQMCERIEKGDDELKHRLPVWTPSCAEFKNNHRAAADALKPLNRLMMDFDEKGHTEEICEKLKDAAQPDIRGMWILLIEESARRGTHVLVELPAGMDAETAQQIMKEVTGYEPDRQVKGVDRCIYMVPEDHTKFVSERLFRPPLTPPVGGGLIANAGPERSGAFLGQADSSGAFVMRQQDNNGICNAVGIANPHITSSRITNSAEQVAGAAAEQGTPQCHLERSREISPCASLSRDDRENGRGVLPLSRGSQRGSEQAFESAADQTTPNPSYSGGECNVPTSFEGIPYSTIIAEYWRKTGGEPPIGKRNTRLHQLAANLRAICDNNEEWLLEVMPRFELKEQEMRSIIHSACKEPTKGSKIIDTIVDFLGGRGGAEVRRCEDTSEDESNLAPTYLRTHVLPKLPIGLKESLVGVPASMHMPVLCGVMPICGAYADQVEVEYCDGNMQRLGLMAIIRGEQASNKSVVKNAIDVWKRQFDEEDALARKREEEWKERKKGRKANEKAPDDPHVLIRQVPVTVSCSTLLKRFKNSGGHTLFSFGEELDTLRKTNGAGSWSSKYDIYRLAFDRGEWGQDYNSDAAESGVVNVAYNWTMLGTNGALRKCFKSDNIENGLSSRVMLAEMPDSSFSKMPKFKKRSAEDEARIQEAVSRLRSYTGVIDVPRLRKAIEQWVEEKRVEAAKDIDHVKDTYRKRAAVIGFRCGVIFHLLETSPIPSCRRGNDTPATPHPIESCRRGNATPATPPPIESCRRGNATPATPPPTGGDRGGLKKESKACIDFALLMAEYCLQQQIKAFGEALESQFMDARDECVRYGCNHSIFDQLAPTFTMDDLRALKRGFCSEAGLRKIISRWYRDQWIEKTDKTHWKKLSAEK